LGCDKAKGKEILGIINEGGTSECGEEEGGRYRRGEEITDP